MDLNLSDDVVVVMGAAKGIGQAIATEFVREGAQVCWLDRDPEVGNSAAAAAKTAKHKPYVACVDATAFDRLTEVAADIQQTFGRCDHVVVSIGGGSGKYGFPFWNLQPCDWEPVLQLNLVGPVNVAHAFVPQMLPQRRGTICFLSSVAGQIGSQTDPPYSAAKAGLINFAQCAAKDLAPYDIRVNVVSPGMVQTDINRSVWQAWRQSSAKNTLSYEEWGAQKNQQISPLRRWQQPEDIAAMVTFLASHRAHNITGQTLNVDGGQCMHS